MGNAFTASGTPEMRAEQAVNSFVQTVCISNDTADFPGVWTAGSDHLGLGASGVTAITCPEGKTLIILEVLASVTSGPTVGTPYAFTLAEQGSTEDIVRLSVNGGSPGRWEGPVKLTTGNSLIYYKGKCAGIGTVVISYLVA